MIEAHRTRCWKALLVRYQLDTVEECMVEASSGNEMRRGYVSVDADQIRADLHPKTIAEKERTVFQFVLAGRVDLDPGEMDLLAYALTLPGESYQLCAPDRAAMRAAAIVGIVDQMLSLEELLEGTGADPSLREQYTKKWLAREKVKIRLEVL